MKHKSKYVLVVLININIISILIFLYNNITKINVYTDKLKVYNFESELIVEDGGINKNMLNLEKFNENTDNHKLINTTGIYFPVKSLKNYDNYVGFAKDSYELEYQEKTLDVSSWEELTDVINNNKNEIVQIDDDNKKCILNKLIVNLKNGGNWTVGKTIEVNETQQIILTTSEDITILRETDFKDNPLFIINGLVSLGTDKMAGKITIDGNNIQALSTLIQLYSGILDIYDNVTLCNNVNKITNENYEGSDYTILGSAIYSNNATINMYGRKYKRQ